MKHICLTITYSFLVRTARAVWFLEAKCGASAHDSPYGAVAVGQTSMLDVPSRISGASLTNETCRTISGSQIRRPVPFPAMESLLSPLYLVVVQPPPPKELSFATDLSMSEIRLLFRERKQSGGTLASVCKFKAVKQVEDLGWQLEGIERKLEHRDPERRRGGPS